MLYGYTIKCHLTLEQLERILAKYPKTFNDEVSTTTELVSFLVKNGFETDSIAGCIWEEVGEYTPLAVTEHEVEARAFDYKYNKSDYKLVMSKRTPTNSDKEGEKKDG